MLSPIIPSNALSSCQTAATSSLLSAVSTLATAQNSAVSGLMQDAAALRGIENGHATPSALATRPAVPFFQRLASGLAGLVLGALTLTGCTFNVSGLDPIDSGPGQDSSPMTDANGDAVDAVDAFDAMDAGPAVGPAAVLPADTQVLPPTRAHLTWHEGEIPAGRTVAGYELCNTNLSLNDINEASECPNSAMTINKRAVLDPLTRQANYFWKVRSHFDDASVSAWSAVQTFSTDNSLVAWWRFNGNALDSGSSGINGTLQNGPVFAAGRDDQALQCDGINDYADMGSGAPLQLAGPLTISAWVNGNGVSTAADSGILNLGALNYALTYHTNGEAYFYVNNGGNSLHAPMSANAWHQVAGVFDGTTNAGGMRLYLDNTLAGMRASSAATTGAASNLWIGRYNMSYFKGLIDNVTIYNRVLSDAELLNESCATQAQGGVIPLPPACEP